MTKQLPSFALSICAILFLITISSCHYYPEVPELLQAETLMENKPDSALTILNNIKKPNSLSNKDHAMYCLLLTQAQDKNYITHTSDSLIKIAAEYFDQHKDRPHAMLAYYYMGRVYSDLQDALAAQECYLKALEYGENSTNYNILIKIWGNLGSLYSYQDVYDMALPAYQKTLYYLKKETKCDSLNMSFALRNIARIFVQTHKKDSALHYYNKALQYSTSKNKASVLIDLGNLYLNNNKYEKALEIVNHALTVITNQKTIYPIYLSKGEIYLNTGLLDSANFYLNLSLESPNPYTKSGSLYLLAKIAKQERKLMNYIKYTEMYEVLNDTIKEQSYTDNIRITQSMFNYQRVAKEKSKYEKEANQRMMLIYQLAIISIVVISIGLYFGKREFDKKRKLVELRGRQYLQSKQRLEDNERKISELTEELNSKQKLMTDVEMQLQEVRMLILKMENRQIIEKQNTIQLLEKDLRRSSIYIKIHKNENPHLTKSEWEELQHLLDATYLNFTNQLIEYYPQISLEERRICYLAKINVPIKKIASIMCITSSGVSQCRRRLYKKFTGKSESTEMFDQFIADF